MNARIIDDDVNVMLRCDYRELSRSGGDLGGLLFHKCSQCDTTMPYRWDRDTPRRTDKTCSARGHAVSKDHREAADALRTPYCEDQSSVGIEDQQVTRDRHESIVSITVVDHADNYGTDKCQ